MININGNINGARKPSPFPTAGLIAADAQLYTGNPLGGNINCGLRDTKLIDDTYYLFEESTQASPAWWITYRTSKDRLHWSFESVPILSPGGAGEFDENGQADPTIIYDGSRIHMWYDALSITPAGWISLGYAYSDDKGATWTKVGAVLSIGSAGEWDDAWIHQPTVIKYKGIFYMFYAGSRSSSTDYEIGLATATNPEGPWTKYSSNPIISYGNTGDWDEKYIRPSTPVLVNGVWFMYYWGADADDNLAIGLATSVDLKNWIKQGKKLDDANKYMANNCFVYEGSNYKDKLIGLFTHGIDVGQWPLRYIKFSLPITGTKIDQFTTNFESQFGDNGIDDAVSVRAANYVYYFKVSATSNQTVDNIKFWISSDSKPELSPYKIKVAVYSNSSDLPNALLVEGEEKDWSEIFGNEWNDFQLNSDLNLTNGTDYWIAVWSNRTFKSQLGAGGSSNWNLQNIAYGEFPASATPIGASQDFSGVGCYLFKKQVNVYRKNLVSEPNNVYFNTVKGKKQTSIVNVNGEYKWYWESGVLYLYSMNDHPDLIYNISYD